jgi:hypothetical protein
MPEIPEEFPKIANDFISDIGTTFPEYQHIIDKWWNPIDTQRFQMLFDHCIAIFPDRFIDILYQKTEIFDSSSDVNTEFLPGISFKYLWQCDISENTRETIWKYLQMILICIIGTVHDKNTFGDTTKLFETINEDEFKEKLSETIENMQTIFENMDQDNEKEKRDKKTFDPYDKILEDAFSITNEDKDKDSLHDNISSMLGGKLGELAREIAEEATEGMNIDIEDSTNASDIFQKLFKNPGNLMNLVKSVGEKLDSRMKSGDINKSELMTEASEMLIKMKNMPGMGDIQNMMSKMGLSGLNGSGSGSDSGEEPDLAGLANMFGLNKNAKLDTNAIKRNEKNAKMKERLKQKMQMKNLSKMVSSASIDTSIKTKDPVISDDELISIFSTGENVERTPRIQKNKNKK